MENRTPSAKGVFCFRRWSRHSWAVFSSVGRKVRIGVLALGCSLLAVPVHSKDSSDTLTTPSTPDARLLDEVVVSAQRGPVLQSELMRVVQVISRAEIEQAPVSDLAGLLQHVRGVDIRTRGAFGMQADVSVRGGTFDQVLILLNGINVTDPQTGHHNLNLPIDLLSIERIEVLQGAGARIFGPNAFSGAINIITRQAGKQPLVMQLEGGMYSYGAGSISKGFGKERFRHFISAFAQRSDGFADNTDFASGNLYYKGRAELPALHLDAQLAYTFKEFGANSFYTPRFPDQFEQLHTGLASLSITPVNYPRLHGTVYWRRQHDRFELFRHQAPEWYSGHNYHLGDVAGAAVAWNHSGRFGLTELGVDYRLEQIYSTVLGHSLSENRKAGGYSGIWYDKFYRRQGVSLIAEHGMYLGNFSFSAGALGWIHSDLDNSFGFFPGIDLGWQIHPRVRAFASVQRTLRLPTFTDMFYSGPANIGNEYLRPEKAISLETGLKLAPGTWTADMAVFRRWGTDMIDWVKTPGEEQWQSMNLTAVTFSGVEAGLRSPFIALSSHGAGMNFSLDYSLLYADKNAGGMVSNYVLDYARQKVDMRITATLTSNTGLRLDASRTDREGGYMRYEDGVFSELVDFEPYWLAHARMYRKFGSVEVYAEVNNLLNSHVVSVANVPQPGRWLRAGVQARLQ